MLFRTALLKITAHVRFSFNSNYYFIYTKTEYISNKICTMRCNMYFVYQKLKEVEYPTK